MSEIGVCLAEDATEAVFDFLEDVDVEGPGSFLSAEFEREGFGAGLEEADLEEFGAGLEEADLEVFGVGLEEPDLEVEPDRTLDLDLEVEAGEKKYYIIVN